MVQVTAGEQRSFGPWTCTDKREVPGPDDDQGQRGRVCVKVFAWTPHTPSHGPDEVGASNGLRIIVSTEKTTYGDLCSLFGLFN